MVRYLMGILTVVILIGLGVGVLFGLDWLGIMNVNQLALDAVSNLPGLEDLAENYQLGEKRSKLLTEREAALRTMQQGNEKAQAKLASEREQFETEKISWQREKLQLAKTPNQALKSVSVGKTAPDQNINGYLATVGGMKADKAAAVLQKLPKETVYLILDQLRASQATKILENLPPDFVAQLTQERLNINRKN